MAKKPSNRVRSETLLISIPDWQEADQILKRIGDLQTGIACIEANAKNAIDDIKTELQAATGKPLADIKLHIESLQAFCANHPGDFDKARSRKLQFGTVGWRLSKSIQIAKNTMQRLVELFGKKADDFLLVKKEVSKDAIADLEDETLREIGAKRISKDVFYAEPDVPAAVDY